MVPGEKNAEKIFLVAQKWVGEEKTFPCMKSLRNGNSVRKLWVGALCKDVILGNSI